MAELEALLASSGDVQLRAARILYEQALASDLQTYGDDHPIVANRRAYLAKVLHELGDLVRARVLYEQSLTSKFKTRAAGRSPRSWTKPAIADRGQPSRGHSESAWSRSASVTVGARAHASITPRRITRSPLIFSDRGAPRVDRAHVGGRSSASPITSADCRSLDSFGARNPLKSERAAHRALGAGPYRHKRGRGCADRATSP
jgi:hypothetical protein